MTEIYKELLGNDTAILNKAANGLEINDRIVKAIDFSLPYLKTTDIFRGKLGIAVAYLYTGSLNESEEIYDKGFGLLRELFLEIPDNEYVNYRYEIPMLGYVLESLKRSDILEIDTDVILSDNDKLAIKRSSLVKFSADTYSECICWSYYLASRFIQKTLDDNNFFTVQLLIGQLIQISSGLDSIIQGGATGEISMAIVIDICYSLSNLMEFLEENAVCKGFAEKIRLKISGFDFSFVKSDQINIYDQFLCYGITNDLSGREKILSELLSCTPVEIFKKYNISISQMFCLFYLSKIDNFYSAEFKQLAERFLLTYLEDGFLTAQKNGTEKKIMDLGLTNGLSAFLLLLNPETSEFLRDAARILTLTNRPTVPSYKF